MRVTILAFASAAEALGARELDLELPAGSRVADLGSELVRRHPALEPIWKRLAVAVDGELAAADADLADGAEVALLPPVSGGAAEPAADRSPRPAVRLVDEPIDLGALAAAERDPGRGALVVFAGRVRNHHRGRPVDGLTYDAYRPMAERALGRIVGELEAAHRALSLTIVHRLGELAAGEVSVVILAASPHRDAAYRASREALERLKREVPIWKREHYADGGAVWREEEPLAAQ